MNVRIFLLSIVIVTISILPMHAEDQSTIIAKAKAVTEEVIALYKSGQKQEAINLLEEFLNDFEKLPVDKKQEIGYIGGWRNLYLAAYYSDMNNVTKAISCLNKAVDYGLDEDPNFYYSLKNSQMFNNIRKEPDFEKIYNSLSLKYDYLHILKNCQSYSVDKLNYDFSYQSPDNVDLKVLRKYFNLDSVAGNGDELSKIKRVLAFVNNHIPHDGETDFKENPKSVIEMTQLCISKNHGANCRSLAKLLNECYLSLGIKSRYITCYPKKYISDCHVINAVWSSQLNKWLYVDPTWNAMVMDENGKYLSVQEVRYRLRNDIPLKLNDDAQLNKGENKYNADIEEYLYHYMAKNLYYISSAKDFYAGIEYNQNRNNWVILVPSDFDINKDVIGQGDEKNKNSIITTNDSLFWQEP